MENKNTYYLLGYDQDVVEETLILLAEGEKHPEHPITTNVMELVHLLQEGKRKERDTQDSWTKNGNVKRSVTIRDVVARKRDT